MPKFTAGVIRFHNEIFPGKRALFEKLSKGQSPEALFITCSDARIDANLITQTEPGDLFICRNAGNIVPPHTDHTGAMTASVEFAVASLKAPNIVVCGHVGCGAMEGALDPSILDKLPHMKKWLGFTAAALSIVEELGAGKSKTERMQMLVEQNVILQLQHLRTHPSVAARLAKNEMKLHGWVYDVRAGAVTAYDEAQGKFLPVEERYRDA